MTAATRGSGSSSVSGSSCLCRVGPRQARAMNSTTREIDIVRCLWVMRMLDLPLRPLCCSPSPIQAPLAANNTPAMLNCRFRKLVSLFLPGEDPCQNRVFIGRDARSWMKPKTSKGIKHREELFLTRSIRDRNV